MEPALSKFLVCALALSLAGSAAAGDEPKKSEDALETARRDLRALPTVEGNVLPGERLPDASVPVPTFTPLTTNSGKNPSDDNRTTPSSEGWLLDALKKGDELKSQQADRDLNKLRGTDPASSRRLEQTTPNPLRTYLDLWLSPQDKRLLTAKKSEPRTFDRGGIRQDQPFRPTADVQPLAELGGKRQPTFGTSAPRPNPYLTPAETEPSALAEPLAPLPKTSRVTTGNNGLIPFSESTYPVSHDTGPTLESRKPEEPLPAPTAPLIDERRYFPQLRRF